MRLRNPGPVQPAPALQGPAGELADAIGRWPGVAAFTHWELGSPGVVDGAEFHVGNPEGIHQLMVLFSDRGTPRSVRHMNAYSGHTYKFTKAVSNHYSLHQITPC